MLDEDAVDAVLQDHQPPVERLDGGGLRAVVGEEGAVEPGPVHLVHGGHHGPVLVGRELPGRVQGEAHGREWLEEAPVHVGQPVDVADADGAALRVRVVGLVQDGRRRVLVGEAVRLLEVVGLAVRQHFKLGC